MVEKLVRAAGGKLIGEFLHFHLFAGLPKYLRNLIGEEGTRNILIGAAREAMILALEESKLIKKIVVRKSFHDIFLLCYKIYAQLGYRFEAKKIEETETSYTGRVTKCPHIKFTKKDPLACFSCFGIKQGVLYKLLGYVPAIDIKKRMAVGDEYCEFEVSKKKKRIIPKI